MVGTCKAQQGGRVAEAEKRESGGQMFSYVGRGRLAWSLMGSGEDLGFG